MSSLAFGPGGLTATSGVRSPLDMRCAGKPQVFSISLAKKTQDQKDLEKYSLVKIFSR